MDINLGKYRLNPRGEYDSEETYYYLDFVSYKGASYYVKYRDPETQMEVPISKVLPIGELSSSIYWGVLAEKGQIGEKAELYESFITLKNTTWNYRDSDPSAEYSDKVIIPEDLPFSSPLEIKGAYDGCCGLILTKNKNIRLPDNSILASDFDYIEIGDNQYYFYTFIYTVSLDKFIWHRSVLNEQI